MNGRTCLITGATDGIGKETAIGMAKNGYNLILIGRNEEKGKKVCDEIRKIADSIDIDFFTADLILMKEVSRVADEVCQKYDRIDVLINNVGAYFAFRDVTEEGFERTFALNHLGYFLMTKKLLPLVEKSDYKRIVNVSSSAHYGVSFEFDNLNGEKKYRGFRAYQKSKLANVMFTYELAKKVKDSGITANCLHPGFVASKFGNNNNFLWRGIIGFAKALTAINVKKGAKNSIHLACSDDVKDISGRFFSNCEVKKGSGKAKNEEHNQKLWEISEDAVSPFL
ncbi:MAG: SDR family oxidoreductase, partial [Candidatus Thermoplasmatota archaeon]|nr:SDR family oxidoreductase [Candidatus Thermoplasmatota archaeon]